MDWCEVNGGEGALVEEFMNSWSNVAYLLAAAAAALCLRGILARAPRHVELPAQLMWASVIALATTGIASFTFHANLRFWAQKADETAETAIVLALLYLRRPPPLHALTDGMCASILAVHIGLLAVTIVLLPVALCELHLIAVCVYLLRRLQGELHRLHASQQAVARPMLKTAAVSVIASFAGWLLDVFACDYVHWMYLHAWWHLGTALAAYSAIMLTFYLEVRAVAPVDVRVRLLWQLLPWVSLAEHKW
eukprot:PLAT791.2.p1 GENE.PLAT791.2~~PLAT791.2.p1  ORF type:complete len:266 (+),score=88.60 PLAT791.2:51-800(+)